jgi:Rod binding domain-containing protein
MSISPLTGNSMQAQLQMQSAQLADKAAPKVDGLTTQQAFQDFVAGTLFKQMLKSLRSTEGEVHYLNGGQAEKMFRSQLDQELAEQLAHDHGAPFVSSLYERFALQQQAAAQAHVSESSAASETPEPGQQIHYLA